jgi:hypothetical protein
MQYQRPIHHPHTGTGIQTSKAKIGLFTDQEKPIVDTLELQEKTRSDHHRASVDDVARRDCEGKEVGIDRYTAEELLAIFSIERDPFGLDHVGLNVFINQWAKDIPLVGFDDRMKAIQPTIEKNRIVVEQKDPLGTLADGMPSTDDVSARPTRIGLGSQNRDLRKGLPNL